MKVKSEIVVENAKGRKIPVKVENRRIGIERVHSIVNKAAEKYGNIVKANVWVWDGNANLIEDVDVSTFLPVSV